MDSETRSWLVGVPFVADGAVSRAERAPLSYGQKRELAGVTGLVMASTVFFLTPLLVSAPEAVPENVVRVAPPPAAVLADPAPVALAPSPAALPVREGMRTPRASTAVHASASAAPRGRHTLRAAPLKVGERPVLASFSTPQFSRTAAGIERGGRKRGSGVLMRVLVGSGRHRVQPFPTPGA